MFVDQKKPGEVQVELEPWRHVLLNAASLLEEDGWCQRRTFASGQRCAVGAIMATGARYEILCKAESTFQHVVGGPITAWNDQPGRTREEVCAALRQAAFL
jgi:hypothetical protein